MFYDRTLKVMSRCTKVCVMCKEILGLEPQKVTPTSIYIYIMYIIYIRMSSAGRCCTLSRSVKGSISIEQPSRVVEKSTG